MKKQKEEINYTKEQRSAINNIIKAINRLKGSKYIKQSFSLMGRSYNEPKTKLINKIN